MFLLHSLLLSVKFETEFETEVLFSLGALSLEFLPSSSKDKFRELLFFVGVANPGGLLGLLKDATEGALTFV